MARKKDRTPAKARPESPIEQPQRSPIDWRRHAFTVVGLWLLALAAYSNSFSANLLVDSNFVIREDARIRAATSANLQAIWSGGYWFNYEDTTLYRPLTTLTYLVNYSILGNETRPAGYHWINFLLHAANVGLAYALGLLIFRNSLRSAALAGLWAVHPVLTESVTNIVGRADLLACFGILSGLLCHAGAASTVGARKAFCLLGLAAASAIAIFSKESGVVLVAMMLVYDLATRTDRLRVRMGHYAAALLPVAIFLYQRVQVLAPLPVRQTAFTDNPLVGAGFWQSRLTAIQVIGRYMALILWPRRLSYDYSYHQVPLFRGTFDHWGDWATVIGLLACAATALLAAAGYRRSRPLFFYMALFFVALAPMANIALLIGAIMAERFLYLPALGFLGCLVWAIYAGFDFLNRRGRSARIDPLWICGLLCLAFALRTHARNGDWQTSFDLYASGVEAAPESYRTNLNLAIALADRGNLEGAVARSDRCLAILDTLPPGESADMVAYANIGSIYRKKGDSAGPGEASGQWYEKSLKVLLQGDAVDRRNVTRLNALNEGPGRPRMIFGTPGVYQELGLTYLRLGQPRKAADAVEYGIGIRPTAEFFPILATAYSDLGDRENAAVALMEGLVIQPGEQHLISALLDLYRSEPASCAIEQKGGSASLNLRCAQVHGHLCTGADRARRFFEQRGQPGEAERVRRMEAASFACPVQ